MNTPAVNQTMDENRNDLQARDERRDLMDVARLAYIYGSPCYQMARLRFRALHQPHAGLNNVQHAREFRTGIDGRVERNVDVVKSMAWLDLSRGPLVLHVPDNADRYYSLALTDFFTNNFAVLGRRSGGPAVGDFLLAGPRWQGTARPGIKVVRAPTNAVWAVVRILVYGPDDLAEVHALQDQFTISRSGASAESGPRAAHPLSMPVRILSSMNRLKFFDVLNVVLTENPPPASDAPVLDRLATIGVGPSLQFNRSDFSPRQLNALRQGLAAGQETVQAVIGGGKDGARQSRQRPWPADELLAQLRGPRDRTAARSSRERGWMRPIGTVDNFGTDYLLRARYAARGIGRLPTEDAMYFIAATDAAGAPLDGQSRYVMRFPPGGLPPVNAFWSLTVYQTDKNNRRSLVSGPNGRCSLGNHSPCLRYGRHGALEIFIQHDPPAGQEENWLPTPEGPFQLTLRAYLPRSELREGSYVIPMVRRRD